MSTFVELEIQNLLKELDEQSNSEFPWQQVAEKLLVSLESSPDNLSLDNITAASRFLVRIGAYRQLVDFVVRHLDNDSFPTPWTFFLEALGHNSEPLNTKMLEALLEGIREQSAEDEAGRSPSFKLKDAHFSEWANDRKDKIQHAYLSNKRLLLDQLLTLRTQQLYEQEKNLLGRLQKLYPGDLEIQTELADHKQRYALDILSRRSPKQKTISEADLSPSDPAIDEALNILLDSLHEHAEADPTLAFDFAIVAFMLDEYEACLELLTYCEPSSSFYWFRLEALLKARRFVQVLNEIAHVEMALAHESETFFATAYLRAQAYWGLGQKHSAIEVMEGLLASRPNYRAGNALLSVWSQQ